MSWPKNLAIPVAMALSLVTFAGSGVLSASPPEKGDKLSVSGVMADAQGKAIKEVEIGLLVNAQQVKPLGREERLETGSKGGFVGQYRLPSGTLPATPEQIRTMKPSWQTQYSQPLKILEAGTDEADNRLFQAQANLTLKRQLTPAFWIATLVLLLVYALIAAEVMHRTLAAFLGALVVTPLSAMQGEIEGTLDGLFKIDRERLISLHEETNRLKHIIESIEELSRAQASVLELNRKPILLNPFLGTLKERFEKLFSDKGVKLEFECDAAATIDADPDKLSQILINLLSNALKATGQGDVVHMKAGSTEAEGFIVITDTGSGMTKEELPFVFERFYRASEGGLGLGLAIAKELADAHGGRIDVQSEHGKGSSFIPAPPRAAPV